MPVPIVAAYQFGVNCRMRSRLMDCLTPVLETENAVMTAIGFP
jgi:hypothetical protein